MHSRTWPTLPCRRLCAVSQGLIGPLHPACRAAPSVLSVWCRTAWCCALHCTVCALLHFCCGQRAVGSVTHCYAAWGLWAVEFPLRTAALPEGSGEWYPCRTLPLCLGAVGRASPEIHCLTALGQWAVGLLQCTTPLPRGRGQWNSCNTLPHCLGAVGSATPAIHCRIA